MQRRSWGLLLIAILIASECRAQSIGLFFDADGATCSANIPANGSGHLYILGITGGGVAGGITGAEFVVTGFPAGWFANIVPNPASNLQFGTPLNTVGCNIAFPTCQTGSLVLLYTIDFFATTLVSNQYVVVHMRNPPLNSNFSCPLMTQCGFPYSIVCGTGGAAIINPTGPGCTVAVENTTWSRMKRLYD